MVRRWRILGESLCPTFPVNRMRHVLDLHSEFALGPPCVEILVDIQSVTAEIRRGKKEEEDR